MDDQTAIANTILRTISESPTCTLTGGRIQDAIKVPYPNFRPADYGARNLRDFIRSSVPAVKEVSKAGMDIIYGLRDAPPEVPVVEESREAQLRTASLPRSYLIGNQQIWKTFANPNSPWRLFFQPVTGVVRSVGAHETLDSSWIRVPPCSPEVFAQIARSFIDTVPEAYRPVLTQTLTERKWWLPFFEVLKNIGLRTRWIMFRRDRVIDEFDRTISTILQELEKPPDAAPESGPLPPQLPDQTSSLPVAGETLLRKLAIDAIARMSEAELRALNIPLGYIVDSLGGNR